MHRFVLAIAVSLVTWSIGALVAGCGSPCRCNVGVPEGTLTAACGESACVAGTGYTCSADGRSAEPDPAACPEVHHYSAGTGGQTGAYSSTLSFDGNDRLYAVHVPADYTGDHGVPLLLHFHGWRPAPAHVAEEIAYVWAPTADAEGFIAVAPEGAPCPELDPGEDPFLCFKEDTDGPFVRALTDELAQSYNIDLDRVYLSGHSGGSFFVQGWGLMNATTYAAAVEFSGGCIADSDQYGNSCIVYDKLAMAASRKLPFFLAHNPEDQVVPQDYSIALEQVLSADGCPLMDHFTPYDGGDTGHSIDASIVPEVWSFLKSYSHPM
jgi:poly(3-hydroxybutyrate) depolymerase